MEVTFPRQVFPGFVVLDGRRVNSRVEDCRSSRPSACGR